MQIPGKEDFAETLRYFTARLDALDVDVRLGTAAVRGRPWRGFDHTIIATGVVPRMPAIEGIELAVSYADVLAGRVQVGRRVAVIGAGGIGVDMSVFLTHEEESLDEWMAHWGVGDPTLHAGGLTAPKARAAAREVTLVQRKETPIGIGLGKTSGWAHRAVLKQSGVVQVRGATYDRISDRGPAHHGRRGVATDRVRRRRDLRRAGVACGICTTRCGGHLIGGADVAAELDAKRAIKQATELVAAL